MTNAANFWQKLAAAKLLALSKSLAILAEEPNLLILFFYQNRRRR